MWASNCADAVVDTLQAGESHLDSVGRGGIISQEDGSLYTAINQHYASSQRPISSAPRSPPIKAFFTLSKSLTPFAPRDSLKPEGEVNFRPDPVQEEYIYPTWAGAKPTWEWSAAERREHGTSPTRSSSHFSNEIQ